MATEILVTYTASGFIPSDENEIIDNLKIGSVYKAKLTTPRPLNTENPTDEQRNVAQNRLYWMWLTDMSKTTVNEWSGHIVDDWHIMMKKRYLARIYERDCQDFAEMMRSVRVVRDSGMKSEATVMWEFIVKELSITRATVSQFAEYLTSIERFCHERGIGLRTDIPLCELAIPAYCDGVYE